MNTIELILHHPLTERIGWILLHSLWQGALIGAGFGLLQLALRKQSAQSRYLLGCCCLVLLIGAPCVTLLLNPLPRYEDTVSFSGTLNSAPPVAMPEMGVTTGGADENWVIGAIQSTAIFLSQLAPWLTAAWLCGVVVSSCKLVRGFWWVEAIRRKEVETVSLDLLERLDDLRRRLSISRPVRLLRSGLVEVPTVVGWLRPVILLPASSLMGLTPAQLEAILVHELAHVRRFDYLANIVQCLIETLMFYHPVVWWISRCIREEREHCCDDFVVKVCGNRFAYARALATLEGLRDPMPQFAFAANGGSLLNRVKRLLGASDAEESISIRQVGGLALLGVGLLFILSGIYLNLQTPMYRASARIKVERDHSAQLGVETGKFTLAMWDPYFVQNVCEEIVSQPVLTKVVNNQRLRDEWSARYSKDFTQSPHEIIIFLKGRIGVRPIRNTTFFDISCVSEKPDEAKVIANGVVEAYRQFRHEKVRQESLAGLQVLEERRKEEEERIGKAQSEVDRLREQTGIADISGRGDAPAVLVTAETLRKLEGMRIELEAQVMKEETLLESMKVTPREKLVYSISTVAPDSSLKALLDQKILCEQALIVKRHDYGEQHPEVVNLRSQLEDLNAKISDQSDGILLGMDMRVSALKEQLGKLKDEVEKAKISDIALAKASQPYWEAKRRLEDQQRFSQALATKIATENIEATLPKKSTVEITSLAESPRRPAYPNRAQAAAMILFGILLDVAGIRMIRAKPRLTAVLQPS